LPFPTAGAPARAQAPFMKIAGLLALLILPCALPVATQAQTAKSELQPVDFNQIDSNHDGRLSEVEARAVPELHVEFEMLDANHDGYLSAEEFQAWPRAKKMKARDPGTAPGGSSGAQHLPQH
jgi:hypothetical protein